MQYLAFISYCGWWLPSFHQAKFQGLGRLSLTFSSHNDPLRKETEAQSS